MFDFLKKLFGKTEKVEPEKVEPKKVEPLKEQPVVTPEPEEVTVDDFESPIEEEPKEEPKKEEPQEDEPIYDIKTHSKGWQVILPGAQRATRVLQTQKEAVEYCKENDYQYKIHKS